MSLISGGTRLRISVIGCGHVGLVTAGCMSALGHQVVCAERDPQLYRQLHGGSLPIYEPYLAEQIRTACAAGTLTFAPEVGEAVVHSDVVFLCVGVPRLENGGSDFASVDAAAKEIALAADAPKLVVERSTMPVRTGEQLQHLLHIYAPNRTARFQVAANPQFLREGSAVEGFLHPDQILLGVDEADSEQALRQIYAPLLHHRFSCPVHPQGCPPAKSPEVLVTGVKSAELIKHVSNAFLGVKISYGNVLADLCERLGGDVQEVTHAVGLDRRIGPAFLQAGVGFGGDRLPKDLRALALLLEDQGVDAGILRSAEGVNDHRVAAFLEKTRRALWVLKDKRIALWGLAHKADTDDIRGSPAIACWRHLIHNGARVRAYDPQALQNARAAWPDLVCARDPYEAAEGADALLICTEWNEFRLLDWQRIHDSMARPLVLDGRNLLSPASMKALGFEYHSVGRPP